MEKKSLLLLCDPRIGVRGKFQPRHLNVDSEMLAKKDCYELQRIFQPKISFEPILGAKTNGKLSHRKKENSLRFEDERREFCCV